MLTFEGFDNRMKNAGLRINLKMLVNPDLGVTIALYCNFEKKYEKNILKKVRFRFFDNFLPGEEHYLFEIVQ